MRTASIASVLILAVATLASHPVAAQPPTCHETRSPAPLIIAGSGVEIYACVSRLNSAGRPQELAWLVRNTNNERVDVYFEREIRTNRNVERSHTSNPMAPHRTLAGGGFGGWVGLDHNYFDGEFVESYSIVDFRVTFPDREAAERQRQQQEEERRQREEDERRELERREQEERERSEDLERRRREDEERRREDEANRRAEVEQRQREEAARRQAEIERRTDARRDAHEARVRANDAAGAEHQAALAGGVLGLMAIGATDEEFRGPSWRTQLSAGVMFGGVPTIGRSAVVNDAAAIMDVEAAEPIATGIGLYIGFQAWPINSGPLQVSVSAELRLGGLATGGVASYVLSAPYGVRLVMGHPYVAFVTDLGGALRGGGMSSSTFDELSGTTVDCTGSGIANSLRAGLGVRLCARLQNGHCSLPIFVLAYAEASAAASAEGRTNWAFAFQVERDDLGRVGFEALVNAPPTGRMDDLPRTNVGGFGFMVTFGRVWNWFGEPYGSSTPTEEAIP